MHLLILILGACASKAVITESPPASDDPAPDAATPDAATPDAATPDAATTDTPAADPALPEDGVEYTPLGQALSALEAGQTVETCVSGEYQSGFEQSALIGVIGEEPIACWASIPVTRPAPTAPRALGFRARVDACGTLERGPAELLHPGPGKGGFGHLNQYPCQFTASSVAHQEDLPSPGSL